MSIRGGGFAVVQALVVGQVIGQLALGAAWAGSATWTQSSWATHPTEPDSTLARAPANLLGWTRYNSKDGNLATSAVLSLSGQPRTVAVDTATELNQGGATFTGVAVSGDNAPAHLVLASSIRTGTGADGVLVVDGAANPAPILAPAIFSAAVVPGAGSFTTVGFDVTVTAYDAYGEAPGRYYVPITPIPGCAVDVQWTAVPGAVGYHVYTRYSTLFFRAGTTTGTSLRITDSGGNPSMPNRNTTGNPFTPPLGAQYTSVWVQNRGALKANAPVALLAPTPVPIAATVGGVLSAGRYYYRVAVVDFGGLESAVGPEAWVDVTGPTGAVALSWSPPGGAVSFRVYRSTTAGSYATPALVCDTTAASCVDTRATPLAGAPPSPALNAVNYGRVVLYATENITVDATSQIVVSGKGYAGGSNSPGRSYAGTPPPASAAAYYGGGGAFLGGGGYGGPGQTSPNGAPSGAGGGTYGDAALSLLHLGSGGGNYNSPASAGAGAVFLSAPAIAIAGVIAAKGDEPYSWNGCGLGSGGSVFLRARTLDLSGTIDVRGGARHAMPGSTSAPAGEGGGGRVRLDYVTKSGGGTVNLGSDAQQGTLQENTLTGTTAAGTYTSAILDVGATLGMIDGLDVVGSAPATGTVAVRLASSVDNVTWSDYLGPDCTTDTTYGLGTATGGALCAELVGARYVRFQVTLTATDVVSPVVDRLALRGQVVPAAQTLTSSALDTGDDTTALSTVSFVSDLGPGSEVLVQIRSAPNAGAAPGIWSSWMGPGGVGTYYTLGDGSEAIPAALGDGAGERWLQYQVTLRSQGLGVPSLSTIGLVYVETAAVDVALDDHGRGVPGGSATSTPVTPGSNATFDLTIENTGTFAGSFALAWTATLPTGWTATVDGVALPRTVALAAGQAVTLPLVVSVAPTGAVSSDLTLKVTAAANVAKSDSVVAHVVVDVKDPVGLVGMATPVTGARGELQGPTLGWQHPAGSDPITYEVEVTHDADAAFMAPVFMTEVVDALSVTLPAQTLVPATWYRWRVRGSNPYFDAPFTPGPWPTTAFRFETGYPPVAPVARYPSTGQREVPPYLALAWEAGLGEPGSLPAGYEVGVALRAGAPGTSEAEAQLNAVASLGGMASHAIGPLELTTDYVWCARGWNGFGVGPWACFDFTTGSRALPAPPAWQTPSEGASDVELTPTLTWLPAGGAAASYYEVGVGSTDDAAKATAVQVDTTELVWSDAFAHATSYRACVRGVLDIWPGEWSCIGFTTASRPLPGEPMWTSPAEGAVNVRTQLTLAWRAGTGLPPDSYEVGVGTDQAAAQAGAVGVEGTSLAWPTELAAETQYLACVRGAAGVAIGPWACVGFTIGAVPAAVTLSYPAAEAIGVLGPTLRLLWEEPAGLVMPVGYRVAVWPTATPGERQELTVSTPWADVTVAGSTAYRWEVRAFNSVGAGPRAEAGFATAAAVDELRAVAWVDPNRGTAAVTQFVLDGARSTARSVAPITTYAWDVGDGSPPYTAKRLSYIYPAAGGYQVRLAVTDAQGQRDEAKTPVVVATTDGRVPPTVRAEVTTTVGVAPLAVRFDAVVGPGSGEVLALVWTLGDGETGEGELVRHTYAQPGTYLARVNAIDNQGLTATDFVIVSVADADGNYGPSARAFVEPPVVKVGEAVRPSCLGTAASGEALAYAWDLGGEATAEGDRPAPYVFPAAGIYLLTCTVTSTTTGYSAQDSVQVEVRTPSGLVPPKILTNGATEVCADEAYLYNEARRAVARGTAPLSWKAGKLVGDALVGVPAGLTVSDGGVVSWQPVRAQIGAQTVVLTVENAAGAGSQELAVNVIDCAPPALQPPEEGCGCRSGGSSELGVALAIAAVMLRRRRHR